MKLLALSLALLSPLAVMAESNTVRNIDVDWQTVRGELDRAPLHSVGSGYAALALRSSYAEQLATITKECGFKNVRCHGIFDDAMGVVLEDRYNNDEMCFNFQYVDEIYDMMLNCGIKPYVELSYMPEMLASGEQTMFWWKANVSPPKDYEVWGKLVHDFTQHLVDRYGIDEVKQWYFEIWNEPDHHQFFSGTQEEYFKLYKVSVEAVKKVNPELKTGGPATSGGRWHKAFQEFVKKENLPLDFFTTHTYGVSGFVDEFGKRQLTLNRWPHIITSAVKGTRKKLDERGFKDVPMHFTEWGASYSSRDPIHDSYVQGPYLLDKLKGSEGFHQAMSYWTFSDIFEESAPPYAPFHGGFGLMTLQGIRKPSYFIYKFFNELENTELENADKASWVSRNERDLTAMLWEYELPPQKKISNQKLYNTDLKPLPGTTTVFKAGNVPNGPYKLEVYRVGYRSNDALTTYLDMGSPRPLSKRQLATLQLSSNGEPESTKTVLVEKGRFELPIDMRKNDVVMIKLIRLD